MSYLFYEHQKHRTPSSYIGRALYLYFLGLSLRKVVKALSYLHTVKRSHVFFIKKWKRVQKFHYQRKSPTKKKQVSEYIVDETILKVGSEFIWLWVAVEPKNRLILAQSITKE